MRQVRIKMTDELMAPRNKREQGAALLISAVVLSLMSVLAFSAIHHSEQESTASGRSRSAARATHAADAGIQMALVRLTDTPPDLDPIAETLTGGASLESRTRTDTSAQNLSQVAVRSGAEGYAVNVGSGVASISRIFLVNVTAESGVSTAEIEAKLSRTGADATGY